MTNRHRGFTGLLIFLVVVYSWSISAADRAVRETNSKLHRMQRSAKFSDGAVNFRKWIDLEVSVNFNRTLVKVDEKQVYYHKRNLTNVTTVNYEFSTGIHLVVLHQTSFKAVYKKLFLTAQPAADKQLLRQLVNIHDGRLVVIIGYANFTFWLRKEAKDFFYDLGSFLGPEVAQGEFWVLIFRKGVLKWKDLELDADYWDENFHTGKDPLWETEKLNRERQKKQKKHNAPFRYMISASYDDGDDPTNVTQTHRSYRPKSNPRTSDRNLEMVKILYEGVSTIKNYPISQAVPFQLILHIESEPEKKCIWHDNKSLEDLAKFCSLYDGYKPFCRCQERAPLLPKFGDPLHPDYEIIPVAIVTAERLTQVVRQVRRIRAGDGGNNVPILLCVDGFNPEAKHLARLLSIPVVFHNNKYVKATRQRVNEHVRWSLRKVMELNEKANYTIILEDDLDLSPDFVRYFQQIAWLMDVDPTITVANAYNYNAYPHTATDPTRLYIVQSYPYYGWMVRRRDAMKMVQMWAPHNMVADWDLYLHYHYLNQSYVIIPEIPRTKHLGGGGVHVSGYVQETTYNVRPLNKIPNVDVTLDRMLVKTYSLDLMKFLLKATILNITKNPCSHPPLSSKKPGGKYVLYLNLTGDKDEASSFYTVSECLGFDDENKLEIMEGTFFRKYFYNELLIVSCPVSPYCHIDLESPFIYTPSKSAVKEAEEFPFVHIHSETVNMRRIPPETHFEEMNMQNFITFSMVLDD